MHSSETRVAIGGAAVVGVAFGMARYTYGLTLPDMRAEFDLSQQLTGLVASATFVGYLIGLLGVPLLTSRRGPRAPTTIGGVCGVVGCSLVAASPSPWLLGVGAVLAGSAAGWVWAPYSDITKAVASWEARPTLLAVITTGTGVGLMGLGALGVLAPLVSWRLTWAGVAVAAAVATVVNRRLVPALPPPERAHTGSRPALKPLAAPLFFSVAYFVGVTVYITYLSDAANEVGLPEWSPAPLFALIGLGGLVAFWTGRMTATFGPATVGVSSLVAVGVALVILGSAGTVVLAVLVSALLLGAGFMVGSSILAIWTAHASPDTPGAAFTVALVVGAVTSILTPTLTGMVLPAIGLATTLMVGGAVALVGALLLTLRRPVATVTGNLSVRGGRTS